MPERLEVQRAVAASAGEIFAVLADPRGHVAIDSSGMLMAASGDAVGKAGDTFVVHMDREALNDYPLGLYDVTVEIVTFEPDREIAWTVHGQFDLGHVYGYRLEPIAQGTLVTSYYDWSAVGQNWLHVGQPRAQRVRAYLAASSTATASAALFSPKIYPSASAPA
jgi:hypothetical protein